MDHAYRVTLSDTNGTKSYVTQPATTLSEAWDLAVGFFGSYGYVVEDIAA